jgi:xanthine dehydrogenase accessory factor
LDSFHEKLFELLESATPFVSVTLVEAAGSTPQDRGSKMLVTEQGLYCGTIGGGRAEHTAIEKAKQMLADPSKERTALVEWNLRRDLKMVCGGEVKVFFDVHNYIAWRIAIFGAGHVANALVRLLINLDCHITCYDSRSEWLAKMPESPKLKKVHSSDLASEVKNIPDGAFVALMTMGHATDKPVLAEILRQRTFPYIGVIGSKSKAAELRKYIVEEAKLGEEACSRFICPIGLPIGTNHPGEIAVSISAQLIGERDRINQSK